MNRIDPVSVDQADPSLKEIYKQIEKSFGKIPNIFLNFGNSPVVLKAYLSLNEAANKTSLDAKLREEIALVVGQANQCDYCLAAHTAGAKRLGLPDQEILMARQGEAKDAKTRAILHFARRVVEQRGKMQESDIAALKSAGVTAKELVEIIFVINLNMFTNYFNHITDPSIDFPAAPELQEVIKDAGY